MTPLVCHFRTFLLCLIGLVCLCLTPLEARKIGIFFGNFDPIHQGHTTIVEKTITQLKLDLLYVIPYYETDNLGGEDFLVRYQLIRKALPEVPNMKLLSSSEVTAIGRKAKFLKRGKEFFEKNLLEKIQYDVGWDNDFYHIMGTDEFLRMIKHKSFPGADEPRSVVVIKRSGFNQTVPHHLLPFLGKKLFLLDLQIPRFSSRKIRKAMAQGQSGEGLLKPVFESIQKRGFYRYPSKSVEGVPNQRKSGAN